VARLIYRAEAAVDIADAHAWYERQRAGLGAEFLEALEDAEQVVAATPTAYP